MKKSATIYIIGGGKGGVGKTMASIAMVDWLGNESAGNQVTLIETDDSNPDSYKSYETTSEVTKKLINLDSQSGWITLMNEMPGWASSCEQVVINTAARATTHIENNLRDFLAGALELSIDVRMIWVINRQRDGLNLISNLLKIVDVDTTIVKNLYYGDSNKFSLFDKSELKNRVRTIELPDLNDEVSDKIFNERLPLHEIEKFQFGQRVALQRFRGDAAEQFKLIK